MASAADRNRTQTMMSSPPPSSRAATGGLAPQLPVLDGVRGLAVLLVIPHNLHLAVEPDGLPSKLIGMVLDRGWIGVQLFFVLSGFLITRILIRTSGASNFYQSFFTRRALRIWPLYFLALILLLVVLPQWGLQQPGDPSLGIYLWFFLSNFVQPLHPGGMPIPHFWSLAVEEQFYLLWPFIVRKLSPRRIVQVSVGLALLSLATRWLFLRLGMPEGVVYEWTPCRMDALALGAAVAALSEMPDVLTWLRAHTRWLDVGFLAVLGGGAVVSRAYDVYGLGAQTLGYSCLSLAMSLWVLRLAVSDRPASPSWLVRTMGCLPLRKVGQYSFGMYVIHLPLGGMVLLPLAARLGWTSHPSPFMQIAFVCLSLLACLAAAMLSYHLMERHFLKLKPRLAPIRWA